MKQLKLGPPIAVCCAILTVTMVGGLFAEAPQSAFELPPNQEVVAYLLESVNWYRHVYAERGVASDPDDLLFLKDNQAIEEQIARLSFEFAKADSALAAKIPSQYKVSTVEMAASAPPSDLAHFIELKDRSDQQREKVIQEVATLERNIGIARKADRKKLRAALDDAQSRLALMGTVSQTVAGLIEFVQSAETGQAHLRDLDSTIDDLAQSLPEVSNSAMSTANWPAQDARSTSISSERDSGALGLASEVSVLNRKLHLVDEKVRLTEELILSGKNLRKPMTGFISRVLQSTPISDNADSSLLRQQKSQLDSLTLQLKELSPAIIALDKQKVLLAEYKSHLLLWRTAVASNHKQAWKRLLLRLVIVLSIVGLIIGIGTVARRLALSRIPDLSRQGVVGMIYRLVTMLASFVAAVLGLASDVHSFVTYFGLLTAGLAVALQNVITAGLGYLFLIGKRGVRIGDRVQISDVTGQVIYMGLLQFQLREFDVRRQAFTGQIATFSNSLVFMSPATSLRKFGHDPEKQPSLTRGAAPDSARA